MKRAVFLRFAALVALATIAPWELSTALAQSPNPAMRFVTKPGYTITVSASGWLPRSVVVFSVRAQTMSAGVAARTNAHGVLTVGITGLSMCAEPTFAMRDVRGKSAQLRAPGLGCPIPRTVPTPVLHVLSGRQVRPKTFTISELKPMSINLPFGTVLRIAQPGGGMPFIPRANARYLVPLAATSAPPPGGATSLDFLAVHEGRTAIDMFPACRQTTPACAIADFLIRVRILPPVATG
ncbi:MAG TPA: hypothetical protein VKX16_05195 [Chloroflexota bacterium]|nr:hypothetical protein [Chloroflexota bacterium]